MKLFQSIALVAVVTPVLGLTGCAYRMAPPLVLQSKQRLRIVSDAPERFDVRVQSTDYRLPSDGRLMFEIKMVHGGCSVYLFDRIPIRKVADPSKEKIVSIMLGGVSVKKLSFQELSKLQADSDGYHQLALSPASATQKHE